MSSLNYGGSLTTQHCLLSLGLLTLPTGQICVHGIFVKHSHEICPEYSKKVSYEISGNIPK